MSLRQLPVVALVSDLLFASKITSAAKGLGIPCVVLRDPARLTTQPARLLVVDLQMPGAIEAAARFGKAAGVEVAGFVSHVDETTMAAAQAAGLTHVLARGQFAAKLNQILQLQLPGE